MKNQNEERKLVVVAKQRDEIYRVVLKAREETDAIAKAIIYWYEHETLNKWQMLGMFEWIVYEYNDCDTRPLYSKSPKNTDGVVYFP